NDFFRQFLDPGMVYSSGTFLDPDEPLEKAQLRKIDLICRKLQLRPGQRLLDIGCGWGTLAIHAAAHFGVEVMGVTLSEPQADLATAAADKAGVGDRVSFKVLDYRNVQGRFDAISSVGMFEHVGKGQLGRYFAKVRELLEPGGTFLNHGIVSRDRSPGRVRPSFLNTYVFPDGEVISVDEVIGLAEDAGFELRDAEALRTSYALTLRHWVDNLETNREAAVDTADEITYRIWRVYMAGSAVAFDTAAISVYQLLLDSTDRPWTFGRSHLLATDDH
ncbi:MAG: class I SAM-dependent methyltransferase, partial [Acidimicrobiia bacterium]